MPDLMNDSQSAGFQARRLTDDIVTVAHKVNQHRQDGQLKPELLQVWDRFIKSWSDFVDHISGAKLPWYAVFRQMSTSLTAALSQASIYNAVQVYQQKFNQFNQLFEQALQERVLLAPPEEPHARRSEQGVGEWAHTMVNGALMITGIVGGIYLLQRFWPKKQETVAGSAEAE